MTCFPSPDGSFFRVILEFSDRTDFAQILLLMLELRAPAPVSSPLRADTAVQGKGSPASQRAVAAACASGEMEGGPPGGQSCHSIKWKNLGSPYAFSL